MAFSFNFCLFEIDLSCNSNLQIFKMRLFLWFSNTVLFVLLFVYILLLLVFHLIRSENNKTKHWVALLLNKERSNKLTIEDWAVVTTAPHSLRCILTNCIQSLLAGLLASREPEKREHPSHTLQSHLIDYLSAKTKFCLFPEGLHSYLVHS